MLSLNDTADVMAQNLSQNFVLHGRVGLASDRVPKLSLNHAERAFDIRAKMVSLQERLSMVVVAVEHLRPQTTSGVSRIALEGDQGAGPYSINRFQVVLRGISKISRYFRDIEVGGCVIEKGWEHGAIICIWPVDLNRRDDVGSHTTHDVGLNPSPLDSFFAVLVVEPTVKSRRGETGRVTGKTCLPGLQGQTALGDKIYENGGDSFGFQSVENRVVARQFADESIAAGCPEIAHKPTPRDRGVYFEDGREKGIRNGDWPSSFLGSSRLRNTSTEIFEQDLEVVLFIGLCSVVSMPVLAVGPFHLFSYPNTTGDFTPVFALLFLNGKFGCPDVLTLYPASVKVGTTASGGTVETNGIMAFSSLGWNDPLTQCAFNDLGVIGDTDSSELSLIHGELPSSVGKDRGKLDCAGLLRCHERLAGYDPGRVLAHPAGSDGGGGGTRTHKPGQAAVLKTAVFAVSPHPHLNSFPFSPSLKWDIVIRGANVHQGWSIPSIVSLSIHFLRQDLTLILKPFQGGVDHSQWLLIIINGKLFLAKVSTNVGSRIPSTCIHSKQVADGVSEPYGLLTEIFSKKGPNTLRDFAKAFRTKHNFSATLRQKRVFFKKFLKLTLRILEGFPVRVEILVHEVIS